MTHLTVAVRVRPLSDREISAKAVSIVSVENGKTISVTNIKVPEQNAGDSRERVRRFTFDYCFNTESTQDDVFQNIGKDIGKAIRKRFHSCVLAYGQSSTGKTHTMIGQDNNPGLVPKLCQNIFDYLAETALGSDTEGLNATVSYLEIYNEKVRDLLDNSEVISGNKISLKVREHPKTGPYVQGLIEKSVTDAIGLLNCLETGNLNRRTASTNANPRSSRSHCVFTVTCSGGVKLKLVDLAGSERAGTRCHTTHRFREGANINRSLVALRNVISALADQSRSSKTFRKRFIPYRDSTLTWLLRDTLGGNSKTTMISTISPSSTCYNETVNTLRFGQRAKQIVVQPIVNEDPKERTIRELRAEIAKLKDLLASTQLPKEIDTGENVALIGEYLSAWEIGSHVATVNQGLNSWENLDDAQLTDSGLTSSSISFDDNYEQIGLKSEVTIVNNISASNFESFLYSAPASPNKCFETIFSKNIDCVANNFTTFVYPATVVPNNSIKPVNLEEELEENADLLDGNTLLGNIPTKYSPIRVLQKLENTNENDLFNKSGISNEVTDTLTNVSPPCVLRNSILKCTRPDSLCGCSKSVHFEDCCIDKDSFKQFSNKDFNINKNENKEKSVRYIQLKKYEEKNPNVITENNKNIRLKLCKDLKKIKNNSVFDLECKNAIKVVNDINPNVEETNEEYAKQNGILEIKNDGQLVDNSKIVNIGDSISEITNLSIPKELVNFDNQYQEESENISDQSSENQIEDTIAKLDKDSPEFWRQAVLDYQQLTNVLDINQLVEQLQIYADKNVTNNVSDLKIQELDDILVKKNLRKLLEIGEINLNRNLIVTKVQIEESNASKEDFSKKPEACFEELIPVMDVTSKIANLKTKSPLRRTYSVDQKMDTKNPQLFGSHEALQSPNASKITKKPIPPSTLRKRSMDTSTTSLRSEKSMLSTKSTLIRKGDSPAVTKSEKGVVTDVKGSPKKVEIKSKVDSHRKSLIKPRSQIVAAVTQRLYNKIKKKDSATDTAEDINTVADVPKELSICSNARLRLQEITQKALRAHRRRNEETQTDLFPVMRVKEMSTDVDDLQLDLGEVRHIDTSTDGVELKHTATNTMLNCFSGDEEDIPPKAFVFTRTCGTQSEDTTLNAKTMTETFLDRTKLPETTCSNEAIAARIQQVCGMQESSCSQASTSESHTTFDDKPLPISFTKYLHESKYETVNPFATIHPIYTSSVNINVNHNYMNGHHTNESLSDDSLEEQLRPDVCLPTPDLISNHNSLEQHNTLEPNLRKEMKYATNNLVEEELFESNDLITNNVMCLGKCSLIAECNETVDNIDVHPTYAPQTYLQDNYNDDHDVFVTQKPDTHQAKSKTEAVHQRAIKICKPVLVKTNKISDEGDCDATNCFGNVKNSLDYYNEKKVTFSPTKQERVLEAMTNFLQEVVSTMTSLTKVASKLDDSIPKACVDPTKLVKAAASNDVEPASFSQRSLACSLQDTLNSNFNLDEEHNFDVEVIVNNIQGLPKCRSKNKRREKRKKTTYCSETTQTSPIKKDVSTYIDNCHIANKYDDVVIDSCDRLEKILTKLLKTGGRGECKEHSDTQMAFDNLHKFPQPFSVNAEWHPHSIHHSLHTSNQSLLQNSKPPSKQCEQPPTHYLPHTSLHTCFQNTNFPEDSSLDSNPTFSDYGSLPRRRYSRMREPSCSPSGYLRQLTTMRKQIVESSREEMLNDTQLNM